MPQGIISQFDSNKDYGFIEQEDGTQIFFYKLEIIDPNPDIKVGDKVTFDIASDGKAAVATNIKVGDIAITHKGKVIGKIVKLFKVKPGSGQRNRLNRTNPTPPWRDMFWTSAVFSGRSFCEA